MKGHARASHKASILSLALLWTAASLYPPLALTQNSAVARAVVPVSQVSGAVGASIRSLSMPSGFSSLGQGGVSMTALPAGLSLPAAITPQARASAARFQAPAAAASIQAPAVSAADAAQAAPSAVHVAPGLSIVPAGQVAERAAPAPSGQGSRTEAPETAPARRGTISRVAKAVSGRSTTEMFTGGRTRGAGILRDGSPQEEGLDPAPQMPARRKARGSAGNAPLAGRKPTLLNRLRLAPPRVGEPVPPGAPRTASVEPLCVP